MLDLLEKNIKVLIFICLTAFIAFSLYYSSNKAYLSLDIDTNKTTYFQVYWAGEGQNFSETRSSSLFIFPKKNNYILPIQDIGKIDKLRIDPSNRENSTIVFNSLFIIQDGYKLDSWVRPAKFGEIEQYKGFSEIGEANNKFRIKTAERDANFILPINPVLKHTTWWLSFLRLVLFSLLLAWFLSRVNLQEISTNYVPIMLLVALVLSAIMGLLSPMNTHPDEFAHVRAAVFYKYHFILPQICEQDSRITYSLYGASRLNTNEIYYYLAGRVLQLFAFVPLTEYYILRAINIILLGILVLISFRNKRSHLILLPLLLTPQCWYIFSYATSEAFALFVCAIVGIQIADSGSSFRRTISLQVNRKNHVIAFAFTVLLVALIFLIKKNFYFYILFLLMLGVFFLLFYRKESPTLRYVKQSTKVAFLGLLLASLFVVWHEIRNDFERSEAVLECKEELADTAYKLSTPLNDRAPGLYWRDKGYPFEFIFDNKWHIKALYSFFGHYGYLEIQANPIYYSIIGSLFILFILYLIFQGLRAGTTFQKTVTITFVILTLALIGTVMWKSWTVDFQPQGRYLFPGLSMLGLFMYLIRDTLKLAIVSFFTITIFAAGFYSFVFIALAEMV